MSKSKSITSRNLNWGLSSGWLLLILLFACRAKPQLSPPPATQLARAALSHPAQIVVGERFTVLLTDSPLPDQTTVYLTGITSFGTYQWSSVIQQGQATFTLLLTETGLLTLYAEQASPSTLYLLPAEAISPLTPLVGARSIIANGKDWSMVVLIPFDRWGNPLQDGASFQVEALHPDQAISRYRLETANLLAWERIYSHTQAGKSRIAAQGEGIYGPEAILLEVADWPEPFTLSADAQTGSFSADSHHLINLKTSRLSDAHGNITPDGTSVLWSIKDPDGERRIPSYTIDGYASLPIETPKRAGKLTIIASVHHVTSKPLTLTFAPDETSYVTHLQWNRERVELRIGPIHTKLGQYLPDGTEVFIELRDSRGRVWGEVTTQIVKGFGSAEFRRALLPPNDYIAFVTIGSHTQQIRFTLPTP